MPAGMQSFSITKFLGLISGYVDILVDSGYAKLANDIDWRNEKGALQGAKTHVQFHDRASAVLSLCVYNGSPFYTLSSTCWFVDTEQHLGTTTDWGGTAVFTEIAGKMIGANGTKLVKFNGTNLDELGMAVPSNGSFAAAGTGSGAFTVGDWDYKVTYVNRNGVESNAGAAITATAQGGSKASCNLTAIPTGPAEEGITSRRVYRTVTGGAVFYLLTTLNDNTTTTYTDTTVDGSLGTSSPPITHDKPTVTCTMVARVGDRLFIAGDSTYPRRLWYSLPDPYYECFPALYYDDFPSTIKAIYPLGDSLLVLTQGGPILFINLNDVATMRQSELPSKIPADSSRAVAGYANEDYWIGPQGGFHTAGVTVDEFTQAVVDLFPSSTEGGSMEFDTYGTMYVILNYGAFSAEVGRLVGLDWSGKTESFSAEVGKIVRITSTDTWLFDSELGRVVNVSIGGEVTSATLLRTRRGEDEIWSKDTQVIKCIAHSPSDRKTYVGMSGGVYKAFEGDRRAWTWQSVYSSLDAPAQRKQLDRIRLRVNGTVTVSVYGDDDELLHSEVVTTTKMEVKEIWMPPASWSYTFSVKLEGAAAGMVEPPITWFFIPEVL